MLKPIIYFLRRKKGWWRDAFGVKNQLGEIKVVKEHDSKKILKILHSGRMKQEGFTTITWMNSLKLWRFIFCWRNVDKLIRKKHVLHQKNNGKIWSEIKAQSEIYQSDCLSLLQFVIFLLQLHFIREKAI